MDILQELESENQQNRPCKVARWIAQQTATDQQQITEALASQHATETILRVLKRRGGVFSQSALYSHRKGTCTCGSW